MKRPTRMRASQGLRRTVAPQPGEEYALSLYVAGSSSRSREAILRVRELCANELKGRCTLEVIDIYQDPARARDEQILATPTLVRKAPLPMRRLIGVLASSSGLFSGLGLHTAGM